MNTFNPYHYAKKIEEFSEEDQRDYSRFKHGSKSVARRFGTELAREFVKTEEFQRILNSNKPLVICPAPFNNIPTASYTLKDYFLAGLAEVYQIYDADIEEVKVYRKHSYTTEYGEMSAEERTKAINADTFHIDSEFVSGKHVIFVDDCRISGAHEKRIKYMVDKLKLNITSTYVYYAALTIDNADPKIEHKINHHSINKIEDITNLILFDEFTWNTRVVKKVLRSSAKDIDRFVTELMNKSDSLALTTIHTLITYAVLNGYHRDDTMTSQINSLRTLYNVHTHNLI